MHWYLVILFNPGWLLEQAKNQIDLTKDDIEPVESKPESFELGLDAEKPDEVMQEAKPVQRQRTESDDSMDEISEDEAIGVNTHTRVETRQTSKKMSIEFLSPTDCVPESPEIKAKEDLIEIPSSPDPLTASRSRSSTESNNDVPLEEVVVSTHLPQAMKGLTSLRDSSIEEINSLRDSHLEDIATKDTKAHEPARKWKRLRKKSDIPSDNDEVTIVGVNMPSKKKKTKQDKEQEKVDRLESQRSEFRMFVFDSLGHTRPKAVACLKEYSLNLFIGVYPVDT